MRGVPWRSLTLALIGGILVAVAVVPDPSLQNLSNWSTPQLIAALDSDRPAVRRAVVRQLVARSKTVVPALESAADFAGEDRLSGLCEVLEELLLSSNSEAAENAEAALERMSRSRFQPQVSDAASQVLNSNVTLRHARALSKYLEAGGQFPRGRSTRWPAGLDRALQPTQLLQSRILILNEQWTGGDAGLQYVARVFPGETIALHVGSGVPVSKAALDQLLEVRRNTIIRREHESCLGIMVDPRNDFGAVRISDVVPFSPAAQAGLRRNDYLFQLGESPIRSFADLREQAALHPPGERVVILVRRGNREIRFKMPLGSDFGTGECRCPTAETQAASTDEPDAVN
ncbi:MAG: PDZ domain-containing protein [Planctomycetaceae bacterium]|nr:PDZ domain-containing protein [Planctomycetaceae bacterium]